MIPYYQINTPYNVDIYINCDNNFSFPLHLHSFIEFFYVLDGEIQAESKEAKKLLRPGDCMLNFPNQIHSYSSKGNTKNFILLFHQAYSNTFLETFQKYHPKSPFLDASKIPADVKLSIDRLLEPSIRTNLPFASTWIQIILFNLLPKYTLLENHYSEENESFFRIIQYVTQNFREALTLDYLAQELHLNKYYISRLISEHLHMNFRKYLNTLRLDYALQKMQSTNISLTSIWNEAGFESQTTFSRVFKEHLHMIPSEYRHLSPKP